MLRNPPRILSRQRGAATLIAVMVLFFVMSLAAAYANRNLIFEQKTSANHYRATQAFEAADAGAEWALAQLNGGLVDATCQPSVDGSSTFRSRHLSLDASGRFVAVNGMRPGCLRLPGGWQCGCPASGTAALASPTTDTGVPAFRVTLTGLNQPGVLRIDAAGCSRMDEACLVGQTGTGGDAYAKVSQVVALKSALPQPLPKFALTVGRDVSGLARLTAVNDDPASGWALDVGGSVASTRELSGPAGDAAQAIEGHASLLALSRDRDRFFRSVFAIDRSGYRRQPAAVIVACEAAADCGVALRQAAMRHPGRPLWVDGNARLEADVALGTAALPLLLVVDGETLVAGANVQIRGMLFTRTLRWNTPGGGSWIRGTAIVEDDLVGSGSATVVYDATALAGLSRQGSIVRVPGGWRDF